MADCLGACSFFRLIEFDTGHTPDRHSAENHIALAAECIDLMASEHGQYAVVGSFTLVGNSP